MGHEIVVYRDRQVIIHDMIFWTVRHFLLAEAETSRDSDLAAFIRGWDRIGPGVYRGVDFDAYFNGDSAREHAFLKLLDNSRARIQSFGELVPMEYLDAQVNTKTDYFTQEVAVDRLVKELLRLSELLVPVPINKKEGQ